MHGAETAAGQHVPAPDKIVVDLVDLVIDEMYSNRGMNVADMDREGGQGGSALTIQISQAGWTDVSYLSIYPSHACHDGLRLACDMIAALTDADSDVMLLILKLSNHIAIAAPNDLLLLLLSSSISYYNSILVQLAACKLTVGESWAGVAT